MKAVPAEIALAMTLILRSATWLLAQMITQINSLLSGFSCKSTGQLLILFPFPFTSSLVILVLFFLSLLFDSFTLDSPNV